MEKIKLAIIDDELISRNMIKKLIQNNEQYEVVADFADGKSAVNWLRSNEIDILLCDMQMPEMNGVDLLYVIYDEYHEKAGHKAAETDYQDLGPDINDCHGHCTYTVG